jgi:hypothetical protein
LGIAPLAKGARGARARRLIFVMCNLAIHMLHIVNCRHN